MKPVRLKRRVALVTECRDAGELPVLTLDLIDSGRGQIMPNTAIPAGPMPSSGFALVESGDVLFGKLRPYLAKSLLVDRRAYASTEMLGLRPRSEVSARYLAYVVQSKDFLDWTVATSEGTKMPRTSWEKVASFSLPAIPRGAQRAVADFLDAETARIDALITKKRRLIELLRIRQTRWLSHLLRCEVKDEDGILLPSANSSLPLRRVAVIHGGLTVGKNSSGPLVHVPYLRVANVQDGYFDLEDVSTIAVTAEDARRFVLRAGDVLILEGNGNPDNLGRGAVWQAEIDPCLHQNHVHAVRPDTSRLLPEYLALVIQTEWARHFFTSGSAQVSIATLSQSRLGSLPLPVPGIDKQAWLVKQASQRANEVVETSSALNRQIALLRERRQALITAAVTGQIEIPGAAA